MKPLFFIISLAFATNAMAGNISCDMETVRNCLGGVNYHCGPPSYRVVCRADAGTYAAGTLEEARAIKEQMEQKTMEYR
jgi:hypothetical protein